MIYGGQTDEFDYHYFGFTESLLMNLLRGDLRTSYAENIGAYYKFCNVSRVQHFGMPWIDTSTARIDGYDISLNVVANVCSEDKPRSDSDTISIQHNAPPYIDPFL
jgi:hypothetical protein